MIYHPELSVLLISRQADTGADIFGTYLASIQGITLTQSEKLPDDVAGFDVIINTDASVTQKNDADLKRYVTAGGVLLMAVTGVEQWLSELFGVQTAPPGPLVEVLNV